MSRQRWVVTNAGVVPLSPSGASGSVEGFFEWRKDDLGWVLCTDDGIAIHRCSIFSTEDNRAEIIRQLLESGIYS